MFTKINRELKSNTITSGTMIIRCCGCNLEKVEAELTDGSEIYPHREDLSSLPFWKCRKCGNFVGCHHKTSDRTKPLGCIPTKEIRKARSEIHEILDPMWKNGHVKRQEIYDWLSQRLGFRYHTANTRSVEEIENLKILLLEFKVTHNIPM